MDIRIEIINFLQSSLRELNYTDFTSSNKKLLVFQTFVYNVMFANGVQGIIMKQGLFLDCETRSDDFGARIKYVCCYLVRLHATDKTAILLIVLSDYWFVAFIISHANETHRSSLSAVFKYLQKFQYINCATRLIFTTIKYQTSNCNFH